MGVFNDVKKDLQSDKEQALERAGLGEIGKVKYTQDDIGRAQRFADKHRDDVRWCQERKSWFIWNGKVWEQDKTLKIMMLAKNVVNDIIVDCLEASRKAQDEEQQAAAEKRLKEAFKNKSERTLKAMLELAKPELPILANEFDADPFLLNCQNGVIDLRTGTLKKHDPKLFCSKICNASFNTGKEFTLFDKFLQLITEGDEGLEVYLNQVIGMAALGKVFYEGLCIFYGTGNNGKSTFLNCIRKVMGDYGGTLNPEVMMMQRNGQQPAGLADISGKRFVTAIETEEGKRLSSATLKQLASTDPITARRLYENPITFEPTHTLIMATNFLPKIGSTDGGTWRRIAVVPFGAEINGKQVKDYASVLFEADKDAILDWVVLGACMYIGNGMDLTEPEAVKEATKAYRQSEDWASNFIMECCDLGKDFEERGGELYERYKEWCEANSEYKRRPRDFAAGLEVKGLEKYRKNTGVVWKGIRLKEDKSTTWKTTRESHPWAD